MIQALAGIKITAHFAPQKVQFDIDFDIKHFLTENEKDAEHKLISSLIAVEKKMRF